MTTSERLAPARELCNTDSMETTSNPNTIKTITAAFENFDKWETYGTCFKAIKNGTITLAEIQDIAYEVCEINDDIIQMRMVDMAKYAPRTPANDRLIVALGGEAK